MEIKDEMQLRKAVLEDRLVDFVYKNFNTFVMHGGTAVWRCYNGNRFSRDVDFYSNITEKEESELQNKLHALLIEDGYTIREEKYNNKTSTMHIIVRGGGTTGKLDITMRSAEGRATEYLRVDGTKRMIYALSPEAIFNEKINVYSEKTKANNEDIQDLYDLLILKNRIENPSKETLKRLNQLISSISDKPPPNEKHLQMLVLNGITPTFNDIIKILKEWSSANGR